MKREEGRGEQRVKRCASALETSCEERSRSVHLRERERSKCEKRRERECRQSRDESRGTVERKAPGRPGRIVIMPPFEDCLLMITDV